MPRTQRLIQQLDFSPRELTQIVESMERLTGAGDGWINLVPKIADDQQRSTSLGFLTLFGGGGFGTAMCTWIPATHDRKGPKLASLGMNHVTGHRAAAELRSRGVPIPPTWLVEQDHPRRGLVLRVPPDESHELVLSWALRALDALSTPRVIGGWRADIYLPVRP